MEDSKTAEILRDLAFQSQAPAPLVIVDGVATAIRLRDGNLHIIDTEKYQPTPARIKDRPAFHDADSFSAYVKDFKSEATRIFYDGDSTTFTAVMDYSGKDAPSWGSHAPTFTLRHSEEWDAWFGRNAKLYSQVEFGRFIEENLVDIAEPDGATLLEMVMGFEATKNITFREATRLKNGQFQLAYNEEMKTGEVDVPDSIKLSIPVFFNEAPQTILLRFRYRIEEQRLKLAFEFSRPKRTISEAAARVCNDVGDATGIAVHLGKR